ncbi:Ankyrin repeat domain containing protein [Pandoravirus salinus]|uniref:Ankyrin repeat domain containing protein n=1 Tax=Pandoravirus salinus TaxID=1349410 RepID=S4VX17_9VIRU|nr:ankyrin repeat domain [Pandoravirus salinus]AGO83966.1 Ankyrin repeat domain containing protein [Pandoravirus salinus]
MDAHVLQHLLQMAGGAAAADTTTPLLAVVTAWRGGPHRQAKLIHKMRKRLDADPAIDLGARGTSGKTALHLLIDARLNAAARFLVERGADPLAGDADGKPALLLAAMGTKGEPGLGTAFFLAWALGVARERLPASAIAVNRLLNEHILPENAPDADDSPSLLEMAIVAPYDTDVLVHLLLEHGADVSGRTDAPRTPLHLAVNKGKIGVASMLLDRGAAVDAVSSLDGATPLLIAVIKEDMDMVTLLLRHGADPKARMAADVGQHGNPAWSNKDAADLAHMDANHLLAHTLRTWAALTAPPVNAQ